MAATIRKAVDETIAKHELFARHESLPPPADLDAEGYILSAVLEGLAPSTFALEPADFYAAFNQLAYAAAMNVERAKEAPSVATVSAEMWRCGSLGPVHEELERIRDFTAALHVKRLHQQAARVKEMRQRRRILAFLAKLDAALRTDQIDSAKALELLRRRCGNGD